MIVLFKNEEWSTVGILDIPKDPPPNNSVIIMLHAGSSQKTGSRNTFVKLSRLACENGFSAFRFDLPGDGESQVFKSSLDPIKALYDLIDHITFKYNFEHVFLVGHCFGAFRSLELASKYPKKF